MVYTPDPLVCVGVFTAVAVFSAVTFAPTTTAPLGSVTWPVIAPVTVWPNPNDVHRIATTEQASQNCNQHRNLFDIISGVLGSQRRHLHSWSENVGHSSWTVKRNMIALLSNDHLHWI